MTDTNQAQGSLIDPPAGQPIDADEGGIQKVDRRTKAGRTAARNAATPARALARGEYVGRNGELLTRNASLGSDPYEIPPHLREVDWDYQWLTETVFNSADVVRRHSHAMYQAGWRPVMATGRWNGVYDAPSYSGHIRLGDSGLYERPMQMTVDAKAEDDKRARQQVKDRDQSLMGGKANVRAMPDGFAMGGRYRGTGGDIRMNIDPALDVPKPQHQPADDGTQ